MSPVETQWLLLNQVAKSEKQGSPPKLSLNKSSRTPAQDRLKRLQHNLKISQSRSHTSRTTRPSTDSETKTKEQVKELKDQLSTSSSTKGIATLPKKAIKRPYSSSIPNRVEIAVTNTKSFTLEAAKEKKRKKQHLCDSYSPIGQKSVTKESITAEANETPTTLVSNSSQDHLQNMNDNRSSSTIGNTYSGFVKKIKEIIKNPFKTSKKNVYKISDATDEKSSRLINTTRFKSAKRTITNKDHLSSSFTQETINRIIQENTKSANMNTSLRHSELGIPKELNISKNAVGPANSRLEQLKQSLLAQQKVLQQNTKSSTEAHNKNNTTTIQQSEDDYNNSINSLNQTTNCSSIIDDEVEAMDWQPINKDAESIKISDSGSFSLIKEKSNKLGHETFDENKNKTMSDIYDLVNENLLRFSAEKYKDNNKKWKKGFYYFIVDTNVLLKDLSFVKSLTKFKLCDTKGSVLYIPYAVLQELDKLKLRSGLQEGVKTRAVRAIKYLNSEFENNSPHLQAQSALSERHRLVDVNSADDSIINCCLQAKEHVHNLLLLTEDVNLRNKAICSNILASTKSDLMVKYSTSSATDDKS